MKKKIAMLLGIVLTLSLTACGSGGNSAGSSASAGTSGGAASSASNSNSASGSASNSTSGSSASSTSQASAAGTAKKAHKVAFADSFNGSTFRQLEEAAVEDACKIMQEQGRISEYAMVCANSDVATQISQINSFILDGYDIIIIDPASSSGLNDVIQQAVDAGIIVFAVSDGPLDTPGLCYEINTKPTDLWYEATKELCEIIGEEGNVLVSRGIIGYAFDEKANMGVDKALSEFPNVTKAGEIEGEWTDSVAKEAFAQVLPSMNYDVDLIIGQGGDDKVAVDVFEAAGKEVPVIMGQGRGNFLSWWAREYEENGYQTISVMADPYAAAMGVYTALDVADGLVSFSGDNMSMDCGGIILTTEDLEADLDFFKNMADDEVYAFERDYDYAVEMYSKYAD